MLILIESALFISVVLLIVSALLFLWRLHPKTDNYKVPCLRILDNCLNLSTQVKFLSENSLLAAFLLISLFGKKCKGILKRRDNITSIHVPII